MGSSGGGGGGYFPGMGGAASPIPDLPVAGKDSTIGDPYDYGKFQNFLPDIETDTLNPSTTDHPLIQNSGVNPSATGLRPYMFDYKSPRSNVTQGPATGGGGGGGGGGASSSDIQDLRNQLAQLQAGMQGNQNNVTWPGGRQRVGSDPIETWVNAS